VPITGAAITINADEVILDLNGASLHGPGGINSAIGVLVPGRHSVTIQKRRHRWIWSRYRACLEQRAKSRR
jgi:hypothetical protein